MSVTEKDALLAFLFDKEGVALENIKFFLGDRELIEEEEFCQQVHSALVLKAIQRSVDAKPPTLGGPKIDVLELVAAL